MTLAYFTHRACLQHEMGAGHPESPHRLRAIEDQLIASGLISMLQVLDAPPAEQADLARVHDAGYLAALEAAVPARGLVQLDPDTALNPHTWQAALRAAGAAAAATDAVMSGAVEAAFCAVRPPGHHAGRARAMGFCFLNNVAVAAARALEVHGLERVAIADFDVHHGNGTEEILGDDPRIMLVSVFQHPFYPYSGAEPRSSRTVNVPLAAYSAGAEVRAAVEGRWLPALEAFRPQMLLISAGFDGHREDDMAMLNLVESDYAWITEALADVARRHAGGRIVSVLEGGYALHALGRSVVAHLRAIAGL